VQLCDQEGGQQCTAGVCDPTHPRAAPTGCRNRLCDDQAAFVCPAGTECNSRAASANPIGCAPIGDTQPLPNASGSTDTEPMTPTPSEPEPVPMDGSGLPKDPEPNSSDSNNEPAPEGSADVASDVNPGANSSETHDTTGVCSPRN
jgi:hypothetical protein